MKETALLRWSLALVAASVFSSLGAAHTLAWLDMNRAPVNIDNQFRLTIRKKERRLYLHRTIKGKEELVKTIRIALGNQPIGSKKKQGDGATPEGDYYITHKNTASKYHLSLGLSYPNIRDAETGLAQKLISRVEYDAIVRAIARLQKPRQDTSLGGDIFIHGGGTETDWTLGCIAVDNRDIEDLFALLPVKTIVTILP